MKLEINGETYQVPREYEMKIFEQLWQREALSLYQRIDKAWRVLAMPFSRAGLALLEGQIMKETGDREKACSVRPPKRDTDPNLWLGELLARMLLEGLKHVIVSCETGRDAQTGERLLTGFNLQIESRPEAALTEYQGETR